MFSQMDHFGRAERANLVSNALTILYKRALTRFDKFIDEIAQKHFQLLPNTSRAFRYHGVTYGLSSLAQLDDLAFTRTGSRVVPLHDTLHVHMGKYHRQIAAIRLEREEVRNYLSQLVMRCRNHADVKLLMPQGLWPQVQHLTPDHQTQEPTLTDSERATFLEKYAKYETLVLRRLFTDVVLA